MAGLGRAWHAALCLWCAGLVALLQSSRGSNRSSGPLAAVSPGPAGVGRVNFTKWSVVHDGSAVGRALAPHVRRLRRRFSLAASPDDLRVARTEQRLRRAWPDAGRARLRWHPRPLSSQSARRPARTPRGVSTRLDPVGLTLAQDHRPGHQRLELAALSVDDYRQRRSVDRRRFDSFQWLAAPLADRRTPR